MNRSDLRGAGARLRFLGSLLGLCFVLLVARAAQLTIIDPRGAERGRAQTGTVLRVASARGAIVDRLGAKLAVTMPAPSVYAVPSEIEDVDAAARALGKALGRNAAPIRKRLAEGGSFVFVARWLPEAEAKAVEALDLAGIGIVEEPRRTYPLGELGGRLLGFANIDGEGVRGVEQQEDGWLRGHDRRIALERDARGNLLAPGGVDPRATAGGDVALTIDSALQAEAEQALHDVVRMTGATGGVVVAMDPASGDLLAIAESPVLDPAAFRKTPYASTGSRAFLEAAEPGSVLKLAVVGAALDADVLGAEELIDCEEGSYRVPGKTLRDTSPHGLLDAAGILRVSSNIGAAKIGERLSPQVHHAALRALGFGTPTGSGFPSESAGLLRAPEGWRPLDQATISFGQGVNVTPVQLAAAGVAVANGGTWRTPRLISARRRPNEDWIEEPLGATREALPERVADQLRAMLETVTQDDGTARRATLQGASVAGKTGTAQKFDREAGRYSNDDYQAWFLGMTPAEEPRVVIVAMVDEPRGRAHGGGDTAAPLFARVAAAALARTGKMARPRFDLSANARVDGTVPKALAAVGAAPPTTVAARPPLDATNQATQVAQPTPSQVATAPEPEARPAAPAAPPAPVAAPRHTGGQIEVVLAVRKKAQKPVVEPTRPTPELIVLDDRVLLPDFRGLTRRQVKEITDRVPFSLEVRGDGRVTDQDPAPGTILGANAPLRLTLGGDEG
jgi:cell division protein FtsI (penicillin-binding protein 3)